MPTLYPNRLEKNKVDTGNDEFPGDHDYKNVQKTFSSNTKRGQTGARAEGDRRVGYMCAIGLWFFKFNVRLKQFGSRTVGRARWQCCSHQPQVVNSFWRNTFIDGWKRFKYATIGRTEFWLPLTVITVIIVIKILWWAYWKMVCV